MAETSISRPIMAFHFLGQVCQRCLYGILAVRVALVSMAMQWMQIQVLLGTQQLMGPLGLKFRRPYSLRMNHRQIIR